MSKLREYKKKLEKRLDEATDQAEIDEITSDLATLEEAIVDEEKLLKDYKSLARTKKTKPSKKIEDDDDDDDDDDIEDDDDEEEPLSFDEALKKALKIKS